MNPEIFGMAAFQLMDALLEELRASQPDLRLRTIERARSSLEVQPSDVGWNDHKAKILHIIGSLA